MSELGLPFLASALLAGVLVSLVLWSGRRLRFKLAALGVLAVFLVVQYGAVADLLSRPKPIRLELASLDPEKNAVVASQMRDGEAIFLWMVREGYDEPRAYRLPWSEEMARQLHEAKRESEQNGGAVRMRYRKSDRLVEGQKVFYTEPQAAPPPKRVGSVADATSPP